MSSEIVDFLSSRVSPPIHELKEPAPGDAELEAAIRQAVELKPEKHDFLAQPGKIVRFMAQTGG